MALNSVILRRSTVDGLAVAYVCCGDCGRFAESETEPTSTSAQIDHEDFDNDDVWYDEVFWILNHAEDNLDEYNCDTCDADGLEDESAIDCAWDKNWEDLGMPVS